MLAPDLGRPEISVVEVIGVDVADDIVLLEKETHGCVEFGLLQQMGVRESGGDEEPSQAFAYDTGDVPAVEVVFCNGIDT